jgi:small subunit ribosomal protein S2
MQNFDKKELSEIGVQFGNLTRKWNPLMKPYIYGKTNKNKIYTLNIEKIVDKCKELKSFISEILDTKEKTILFLSTKKQARELVKEQAKNCNMPYIVNK